MQAVAGVLRRWAVVLAAGGGLAAGVGLGHVAPDASGQGGDLTRAVAQVNAELRELRQERLMPALVVSRSSASVCFLYAEYRFEHGGRPKPMLIHVSGTGFVVAEGVVATNRHVAEPWWGDPHMAAMRQPGHAVKLDRLLAFFPGRSAPVELSHVAVSPDADLAVARFDASRNPGLQPLPLSSRTPEPGDAVMVLGYPMGVEGLLAKSPRGVARNLSLLDDDASAARQLAAQALIRPWSTQGHLGDVVADKLLYDASTAQGASGSPVFNAQGEVIGVNAAFLDGFSGGGIGVAVARLRPLLAKAHPAH